MKDLIFIFISSIIVFTKVFAQGNPPPVSFTTSSNATYVDDIISENNKFGRVVYANQRNETLIKNVYLFDDHEGFINVYTKDGKGFKIANANFELIKQRLEVKMEDNKVFAFDNATIDFFVKNNHKYIFIEDVARPLHEELLKTKKSTLLKGYTIIKMEAMTNPLTNEVTKPAFYSKDEVYFLQQGDKIIEIPNRMRKFLKLFDNKSKEVKEYIYYNKLSHDEDADLIKIFNYYNSI